LTDLGNPSAFIVPSMVATSSSRHITTSVDTSPDLRRLSIVPSVVSVAWNETVVLEFSGTCHAVQKKVGETSAMPRCLDSARGKTSLLRSRRYPSSPRHPSYCQLVRMIVRAMMLYCMSWSAVLVSSCTSTVVDCPAYGMYWRKIQPKKPLLAYSDTAAVCKAMQRRQKECRIKDTYFRTAIREMMYARYFTVRVHAQKQFERRCGQKGRCGLSVRQPVIAHEHEQLRGSDATQHVMQRTVGLDETCDRV
jgi:hypothetical protein